MISVDFIIRHLPQPMIIYRGTGDSNDHKPSKYPAADTTGNTLGLAQKHFQGIANQSDKDDPYQIEVTPKS
ncbi:MAG: hypothetical protein UC390_04520 [Peptococcaceae bacterium]|nr:hypothetical protein [Peptococcaceae bacterium]